MNVITVKTKEEAAKKAVEIIEDVLNRGDLKSFGLATGGTMEPVYKELSKTDLDFSHVTAFNLDEYVGLTAEHPNSYAYYMKEKLFNQKVFENTYIPNGSAEDLKAECNRYEQLLSDHPLDLQLLGVGENGHIAFNEPGTPFTSNTHVTNLTQSTIDANSPYFENKDAVPTKALTMGISSILRARKIILLAFGEKKREALNQLFKGTVTEECPVTILQNHPDVTVITDLNDLS
ncbi:glucosamine-6-phosphate deaminase [Chungangia koreensis]|uniref:Glucosamine-6-phosphate deaminase n=1 Tax=Chungangia koreensis TaxID=752657 RepID=A0ABV8X389_9LACT